MASVLVSGAEGFIGRHLVPELARRGHSVTAKSRADGDVAEDATWSTYPGAEVLVHLAGRSYVPDSWTSPADFVRTNVLGAFRALEYCRTHGARIVLLSSYLYGNPSRLPIPEDADIVALNPYALSKKLAEEGCEFYSTRFGVRVTILRPFNVYGPGQPRGFLFQSIIDQVRSGEAIRVKDLAPRRDYIYVGDLVKAIALVVELSSVSGTFNVGSGESHSVAEVIAVVQAACDTTLPVVSTGEPRRDEIMDTVADISRAKRDLGWTPSWSLADGIGAMVESTIDV